MEKSLTDLESKIRDFNQVLNNRDKIAIILNYGIRAPSTHNTQPWKFKILDSSVQIFVDPALVLPKADPSGRNLYISMGCLIENIILASSYFNFYNGIKYYFDQELVAEIFFGSTEETKGASKDLIGAITNRVNARGIFSKTEIPREFLKKIESLASEYATNFKLLLNPSEIDEVATLTAEGLRLAYNDSDFRKEMSSWMNSNISIRKMGIPGYSLRMPLIKSLIIPLLVRFFDIGNFLANLNYQSLKSAPAVAIMSGTDSKKQWVRIGRYAERVMLEAWTQNLNTSIFVAAIEMGELHKSLQNILQLTHRPQFLMAIGKINYTPKLTPRMPLNEKLL